MKIEEKSFAELVKENPTLQIIPLVDTEVVCGDDFTSWYGSFGSARLTEMAKIEPFSHYEITTVFKDNLDDYEESMIELWSDDDENISDDDLQKKYDEHIKSLIWEPVIIAYIGLPTI